MQHMILYQDQNSHTHTKPKSRIKSFIKLHGSLCSPLAFLDSIHLLISTNPLAILGANRFYYR